MKETTINERIKQLQEIAEGLDNLPDLARGELMGTIKSIGFLYGEKPKKQIKKKDSNS